MSRNRFYGVSVFVLDMYVNGNKLKIQINNMYSCMHDDLVQLTFRLFNPK